MKQTKRLFSAFLAILLMVGLVPLAGIEAAWASVPSGGVLPGAVAATRPNVQIDYNLPEGAQILFGFRYIQPVALVQVPRLAVFHVLCMPFQRAAADDIVVGLQLYTRSGGKIIQPTV